MIPARRTRIAVTIMIVLGTLGVSVALWSEEGISNPQGTVLENLMIVSFSSVFTPMIRGKIYAFQVKAVAWTVTGPIL